MASDDESIDSLVSAGASSTGLNEGEIMHGANQAADYQPLDIAPNRALLDGMPDALRLDQTFHVPLSIFLSSRGLRASNLPRTFAAGASPVLIHSIPTSGISAASSSNNTPRPRSTVRGVGTMIVSDNHPGRLAGRVESGRTEPAPGARAASSRAGNEQNDSDHGIDDDKENNVPSR